MGIIIFGASGAGSTTLGKEVAGLLNFEHIDIDDYLWRWDTAIPLTVTRPSEERTELLMNDIKKHPDFVISGTIFSNKNLFEHLFDLAVFVSTPAEICAQRVHAREFSRWGKRVLPGGDIYKATRFHGDLEDYLANAQRYETADVLKFGRKLHEHWISALPCRVMRVDGSKYISENDNQIIKQLRL